MMPCTRPAPRSRKAFCRAAGVALLRSIKAIEKIRTQNEDQKTGVDIVRKALSWPTRQIALNAGEDGSVVVGKILDKEQYNFGFDAQTGEYGNLMTKGIIDPTKVVRAALQARHRSRACSSPRRPWSLNCRRRGLRRRRCRRAAWTSNPGCSFALRSDS